MKTGFIKFVTLSICVAFILGGCGAIAKPGSDPTGGPLEAEQPLAGLAQSNAGAVGAVPGSSDMAEQQRLAEEKRLFDQIYWEQEQAAMGWTESELKALAEMPPNDYDPHDMTPEQRKEIEAADKQTREHLKDKLIVMSVDEKTGDKFWSGEAFVDMSNLITYAMDDPRKAGGYVRFPGEDRFLTAMNFHDKEEMARDAVLIVQTAFEHLPTVNHVDLRIYQTSPDYMNSKEYGTFTVSRSNFEAVLKDAALSDTQRFDKAIIEDDFDAR